LLALSAVFIVIDRTCFYTEFGLGADLYDRLLIGPSYLFNVTILGM